jgi:hypothetical protein
VVTFLPKIPVFGDGVKCVNAYIDRKSDNFKEVRIGQANPAFLIDLLIGSFWYQYGLGGYSFEAFFGVIRRV